MTRLPSQKAIAGDTFAVPLEDGRFSVCRVLQVDDRAGSLLMANAAWIGGQVPHVDDPALRDLLRLTHHGFVGQHSAAWVEGPRPDDFVLVGNVPPSPGDGQVASRGLGGWPFFQIQPLAQWYWDHPEDIPAALPSPQGRFILRRFKGDEVYRLQSAVMPVLQQVLVRRVRAESGVSARKARRVHLDSAQARASAQCLTGSLIVATTTHAGRVRPAKDAEMRSSSKRWFRSILARHNDDDSI